MLYSYIANSVKTALNVLASVCQPCFHWLTIRSPGCDPKYVTFRWSGVVNWWF